MDSVYRGWAGRQVGGGGGWKAEFYALKEKSSHCVLMEVQEGAMCTFPTKCSLIGVPLPSGTIHPSRWTVKVINIMPVKADPDICSSVNGVSGWHLSVAFMYSKDLDFSSCLIYNHTHICSYVLTNHEKTGLHLYT